MKYIEIRLSECSIFELLGLMHRDPESNTVVYDAPPIYKTEDDIDDILSQEKPNQIPKMKFDEGRIRSVLPKNIEEPKIEDDKEEIIESIDMIKNWVLDVDVNFEDVKSNVYSTFLTDKMFSHTMSVNGNTDREYIENYINNMRAQEALNYRKYVEKNIPGVNLNITIPIPESLGGGSFNTFLSIGETIFINV